MIILLLPVLFALALFSANFQVLSAALTNNTRTQEVAHQVGMYQHFAHAASSYMAGPGVAAGPGVVTWETIRQSPTTPPGLAGLAMPPSWKVVKSASEWVLCGEVQPATSNALNQLLPKSTDANRPFNAVALPGSGASGQGGYVVMKATDTATAQQLAALCE